MSEELIKVEDRHSLRRASSTGAIVDVNRARWEAAAARKRLKIKNKSLEERVSELEAAVRLLINNINE